MKNTTNFPPGWNNKRVLHLLRHYESLSDDAAAVEDATQTVMEVLKGMRACGNPDNGRW